MQEFVDLLKLFERIWKKWINLFDVSDESSLDDEMSWCGLLDSITLNEISLSARCGIDVYCKNSSQPLPRLSMRILCEGNKMSLKSQ